MCLALQGMCLPLHACVSCMHACIWSPPHVPGPGRDGILEHYWGEHIHLGYYSEAERAAGYKKKDFKAAKLDFVDEMLAWSGAQRPLRILDVGCGIGGTSRHLAARFPQASVTGAREKCSWGTMLDTIMTLGSACVVQSAFHMARDLQVPITCTKRCIQPSQ